MPFGKTNSTLEFCPPIKLFAISAASRWAELHPGLNPVLSSYVDDIYGGIPNCKLYEMSLKLRDYNCAIGAQLTLVFNKKLYKTPLPSQRQVILGCLFDSTSRRMRSAESKVKKYVTRIEELLNTTTAIADKVMSIHGNLNFAANVTPFGRTFLATLSNLTMGRSKSDMVVIGPLAQMGLRICKRC